MCQLQFTIQTNDVDGDSIKAVQMRYRPEISTNDDDWVVVEYPGITNITNATILQTPNLTDDGKYAFQVQVRDDDDWGEWFSDPDNPIFEIGNCGKPAVNPYYIGLGNCKVAPADWTEVWTLNGNVDPPIYIPVVGDIFYTDSSLTTRYKPDSPSHRVGYSEPPNVFQENKSYNIDTNGEVISIIGCDTPTEGSNDATIVKTPVETTCDSCMSVSVNVPRGETRQVSITRSGEAGYSGISSCSDGATVFSDMNETISETKIYSFGLDAASGSGEQASSRITLSVVGSNSVRLDRSHASPVNKC